MSHDHLRSAKGPEPEAPSSISDAIQQVLDVGSAAGLLMPGHAGLVELIPSQGVLFALGDASEADELAWLADGEVYRLRELMRARRLSRAAAATVVNRLAAARRAHAGARRRAFAMTGRTVHLVESEQLGAELRRIVAEVLT